MCDCHSLSTMMMTMTYMNTAGIPMAKAIIAPVLNPQPDGGHGVVLVEGVVGGVVVKSAGETKRERERNC